MGFDHLNSQSDETLSLKMFPFHCPPVGAGSGGSVATDKLDFSHSALAFQLGVY